MSKQLRAAGYCRTSGESQRDNTSIPNQKEAITRYAAMMGWVIVAWYVDECKSGSKIEGRDDFLRLMRDAANNKFDVAVVFDVKRFGRDGLDILNSAKTLARDFGVHVVDTKGGFDTRDRRRTLVNFVHAGVAEDERLAILERTKTGKIATAREHNAPLGSKRPFGRNWDRATKTWTVDSDKQRVAEEIARRYVAGESIQKLANEYQLMKRKNLHRMLKFHCGPVWVQRVQCRELNIDEVIETKLPPLLDEGLIRAVRERTETNKSSAHGHLIHKYLLSRMVFCGACGSTLSGQTHHTTGVRYYRHITSLRKPGCPIGYIRADDLEDAVFHNLFDTFGNPLAVQRAIDRATPNADKVEDARRALARLESELSKVEVAKNRLVDAVAEGLLDRSAIADKMKRLKDREAGLTEQADQLRASLENVPTRERMKAAAEAISGAFRKRVDPGVWLTAMQVNSRPDQMTWEERRQLCHLVFGGKTPDGKRLGVYMERTPGGHWRYAVRGLLIEDWGRLDRPTLDWVRSGEVEYGSAHRQRELLRVTDVPASR